MPQRTSWRERTTAVFRFLPQPSISFWCFPEAHDSFVGPFNSGGHFVQAQGSHFDRGAIMLGQRGAEVCGGPQMGMVGSLGAWHGEPQWSDETGARVNMRTGQARTSVGLVGDTQDVQGLERQAKKCGLSPQRSGIQVGGTHQRPWCPWWKRRTGGLLRTDTPLQPQGPAEAFTLSTYHLGHLAAGSCEHRVSLRV